MREIRQSGSEGGGADDLGSPYPYQNSPFFRIFTRFYPLK